MNKCKLCVGALALLALSFQQAKATAPDISTQRVSTASSMGASNFFEVAERPIQNPFPSVQSSTTNVDNSPSITYVASAPTLGATLYGIAKIAGQPSIISTTVTTGAEVDVKKSGGSAPFIGGVYVNGRLYAVTNLMNIMFPTEIYDTDSWFVVGSGKALSSDPNIVTLTYDNSTATIYGCFTEVGETNFYFSTYNFDSGEITRVAKFEQRFVAIAANSQGTIYGIAIDGNLYTIDKTTGATSLIGSTGVKPGIFRQEACFDADNGQLYWTYGTSIYVVDTTSGTATKAGTINAAISEWLGLFSRPSNAEQIPSWVNSMKLNFVDASLNGTITFSMPTVDANGISLSGALKYVVEIDNDEFASGQAAPGENVSLNASLTEGVHSFKVYAVAGTIKGLESALNRYIGHDTPAAPSNLSIVESPQGGNVAISWNAVETGAAGGYIDLSSLTYDVVRQPGNIVVAKATRSTSVVDSQLSSLGIYTYSVTANDGLKQSDATTSQPATLGMALGITPPYAYGFDAAGGFGFFTQNNANNDDYQWSYSADMNLVWCMANPSAESDDWLISPPLKVEAGKSYNIQMDLFGSNRMEVEKIEILYGKTADPSAMKTVVLNPTEFVSSLNVNRWFEAKENGLIYIGLHMITKACDGAMYISRFEISAPISSLAPASATGVKATAAPLGAMSADISFTCPRLAFNGTSLSSLSKVIVRNTTTGKEIVKNNPTLGSTITLTDNEPTEGTNNYEVVCVNAEGESLAVKASCWVGLDFAAEPLNIVWQATGLKTIELSWDAPTKGEHGGYIDPDKLTYTILRYEDKSLIAQEVKGRRVALSPEFDNGQDLLSFAVSGQNEKGLGVFGISNQTAFGEPIEAPIYESFENGGFHTYPWVAKKVSGINVCNLLTEIMGLPIASYDDNAMAVFTTIRPGRTRLESPLIDISHLENPVLRIWCYLIDDKTTLELKANDNSGMQWTTLATESYNPDKKGWHLVTADLSAFKGSTRMQIGIEAVAETTPEYITYAMVDKLSIESRPSTDLMLSALSVPNEAKAGEAFTTTVKVTNAGAKDVESYTIELNVNGQCVAIEKCGTIQPDGVATHEIETPLSSNATSCELQASIVLTSDEQQANNTAITKAVKVIKSRYPQPSALINTSTEKGIAELSWEAPSTTYAGTVTDGFENYEHGSVGGIDVTYDYDAKEMVVKQTEGKIGDFKLVDNDKQLTATVVLTYGRIPHSGDGMVCQVIDAESTGLSAASTIWGSHSDNKLICFWQSRTFDDNYDTPNDDYFILPELAADAPTISFWAKSLTDKYGYEQFEIMVSMTGDDISDFIPYETVKNVPAGYNISTERGYTFYEFDLPEGTRYAAIHYNSAGTMALLLDDLTFTPANGVTELTLLGYNIYRDGVRVNDALVTTTSFSDKFYGESQCRYNVTAVFAEGESRYSNTVSVEGGISSVDNIVNQSGRIVVDNHNIVITGFGQKSASVILPDGRIAAVGNADGNGVITIAVVPGIYIVNVGNHAETVVVR